MKRTTCRLWCASLLVCLAAASPLAAAEEQPWLKLMRPDAFVGWDHFEPVERWTARDGAFHARGNPSKLLAGWTWQDFEMKLKWKAAGKGSLAGSLTLTWTVVPTGEQSKIVLRPDALEVAAPAGTEVTKGSGGKPDADGFHALRVERRGAKLRFTSDAGSAEMEIQPTAELSLAIDAGGVATIKDIAVREPQGTQVFNGEDLTGWWCPGNIKAWQVEEGLLVKRGRGGNYLRTEAEYGNFTLSLDYLMETSNNSGIGIRTPRNGWPSGDGMELQLSTSQAVNKSTNMAIYRNYAPLANPQDPKEWNPTVVKAQGYMISAWVNGELVQHANTHRHPELKHRHLQGWIGFQDHGGVVKFRDIHVLKHQTGTGPRPWTEAANPRSAEVVLDRIMNQQRLSVPDGVRSHFLAASLAGDKEQMQTVADLKGPGAIVRVVHNDGGGKLQFYFDGEDKPRIDTSAQGLKGAVPKLADHAQPLLTYVAFEKSLKIVRQGEQPARYLMDYVTLPDDLRTQTYSGPEESIPRGWLASIDYRHAHYRFGQHRDHDPLPRQSSAKHTVEPGSAARLVSLTGAGVVQWTKLHAPQSALENDDLWIEVHVNRESQPAISCPARYFYAAIHDGKNYHNLLMTHRGGYFSRLAMPYQLDLTITAKNQGDRPIAGIGMTVSYREAAGDADGKKIGKLMPLRAKFAGGSAPRELHLAGPGRLVGLVLGKPASLQGIASLEVDGQNVAAWSDLSLEDLLGAGGEQVRGCLSGRDQQLAWRYLLLAPVTFEEQLHLKLSGDAPGGMLALYYQSQQTQQQSQ